MRPCERVLKATIPLNALGRVRWAGLLAIGLLVLGGCSGKSSSASAGGHPNEQESVNTTQRGPEPERGAVVSEPASTAVPAKHEEPAAASIVSAAEKPAAEAQHQLVGAHPFVGAKRCGMCHQSTQIGKQFQVWASSRHARAYETLGTEHAKAVAATLGIDDPQASGRCLKCHATAYGFSTQRLSEQIAVEEGVSCESCHGQGKDYISLGVMKDREKALAAGLQIPDEQTCRQCHNDTAPNVVPFDFAEAWERIKHPVPK